MLLVRVRPNNQVLDLAEFLNVESTGIKTRIGEELVKLIPMDLGRQIRGGKSTLVKNTLSIPSKFGTVKTSKNVSMDSLFNCWMQIESRFIKAEKPEGHSA